MDVLHSGGGDSQALAMLLALGGGGVVGSKLYSFDACMAGCNSMGKYI